MYRSCTFRALQANEYPWELLLDADPSRELVDAYLSAGECVGAFYDQRLVGEYVAAPHSADTLELMNIAVSPHARGGGVGKQLVAECLKRGRDQGFTTLEVGTGNSSIDQLAFYQKCGFRIVGVDRDFFVRNYPEPIVENGIPCRDMVRLAIELR